MGKSTISTGPFSIANCKHLPDNLCSSRPSAAAFVVPERSGCQEKGNEQRLLGRSPTPWVGRLNGSLLVHYWFTIGSLLVMFEGVVHHQKHKKQPCLCILELVLKRLLFCQCGPKSRWSTVSLAFDSGSETAMEIDPHTNKHYTVPFCGTLGSEFHLRRWGINCITTYYDILHICMYF